MRSNCKYHNWKLFSKYRFDLGFSPKNSYSLLPHFSSSLWISFSFSVLLLQTHRKFSNSNSLSPFLLLFLNNFKISIISSTSGLSSPSVPKHSSQKGKGKDAKSSSESDNSKQADPIQEVDDSRSNGIQPLSLFLSLLLCRHRHSLIGLLLLLGFGSGGQCPRRRRSGSTEASPEEDAVLR